MEDMSQCKGCPLIFTGPAWDGEDYCACGKDDKEGKPDCNLFESDKETIWKILNGQTCQSCRDADNDHCDPWCFKKNDHVPRAGVFGCWRRRVVMSEETKNLSPRPVAEGRSLCWTCARAAGCRAESGEYDADSDGYIFQCMVFKPPA